MTLPPRTRTVLAWALWLATMGCCAAGLVAALLVARPLTTQVVLEGAWFTLGFPFGYATVGLVLTLRRPANPIGWLYAAAALTWSLVSRTVTYAAVTALLLVPYLLVVPAASELVAGSGSLAVAAATLAMAALFQPLRRRVQDLVDRRFNRRRYDAARTVDGFARRLRDQVDLDALRGELLGVADQTVQPARASLWLRSPAGSPASSGQEPLGG